MKKISAVILIIFLSVFLSGRIFAQNLDDFPATIKTEAQINESNTAQGPALSGEIQNGVRLIKVIASQYKFTPDPIVIKSGERVRLIITSSDVTHGLAIKEFKVNTVIEPEKTSTVEFVADKQGEFHAYCSVYCGPGHSHMRGTLIVLK